MPLRTCKTILQQVVTVFGRKSIQELEEMDMSDTSFVGAYLHRLVQGQGQSHPTSAPSARMPTAKSSGTGTPETEAHPMPANNVENTGSNPDDRSINQQLKEIFDAIGQPETSKQVCELLPRSERSLMSVVSGHYATVGVQASSSRG